LKKQIFKNFISAWISKFVKLGTSLLLVPIFIDELGKDGYGIIILLGTIISFSVLFEFGVRSGLVRFLAKSYARKEFHEFNVFLNTSFVIYVGVWVILSLLLFFFAPVLVETFNVSSAQRELTITLLRTFGIITMFWSFTSPIFSAVTSALNRYDVTNYRQSVLGMVSIVTIILAVKYLKVGIIGWAVLTIFFDAITSISIIVIAFRLVPQIRFSFHFFRKKELYEMLGFGFISFIGGWSRKMKIDADPLILSSFFSPAAIPVYRSGVSMPGHTRPLIAALSGQIHTVSTAVYSKGDTVRFNKVFETGTKYTLLMGIPMLLIFLFFAEDILTLWLGSRLTTEELYSARLCMQGMALIDFCFYLEGSAYAILYGMNKLKFMTFTDIFLGIINIGASIVLVKYSTLGIPSVLIPTIVLEGIARPLYLYYTAGVMGYDKALILPRIYIPSFLVLAVTGLSAWGIKLASPQISLFTLLAGAFLLGLVWLASTWLLGFTPQDRKDILHILKFSK
jgi:O-antigen/teichoic acid export membrane protein